jgi:hypothetical protein
MEKTDWTDGEIRAFLKEQYGFEVGLMTLWDFRWKYTRPQKDDPHSELIGKLERKGAVLSELKALGVLAQLLQHVAEKAFETQENSPVVKAETVKTLNAAIEAWKAYGEAKQRYGLAPGGRSSTVLMRQMRMQVTEQVPVDLNTITVEERANYEGQAVDVGKHVERCLQDCTRAMEEVLQLPGAREELQKRLAGPMENGASKCG